MAEACGRNLKRWKVCLLCDWSQKVLWEDLADVFFQFEQTELEKISVNIDQNIEKEVKFNSEQSRSIHNFYILDQQNVIKLPKTQIELHWNAAKLLTPTKLFINLKAQVENISFSVFNVSIVWLNFRSWHLFKLERLFN